MSSFDFIVDGITYSYSSASTYSTCPYSFKLAYIDVLPREDNFFSEYGTLVHKCFESYFNGYLDSFELSEYYDNNFDIVVKTNPPPIPVGMKENYRAQGKAFFDNFSIKRKDYHVLQIEDKIDFILGDIKVTARPDLVLQNKSNNLYSLVDYKTAVPFRIDKKAGKEVTDQDKINGYYKQLYLYAYALRTIRNISVNKIEIWFPRANRQVVVPWEQAKEEEALNWFTSTVKKIKEDEDFVYNNTNPYFCNNLCGVRAFCEYR